MQLNAVRLINFRCFADQTLTLGPHLNLICGDNGAGKTSILEGIYLLGRPTSFRTGKPVDCIRRGDEAAQVVANCEIDGHPSVVAMQRSRSELRLRRDGEDVAGYSRMAQAMPIVAVEPGQHRLIEDGPVVRRRLIDWSVFHVEHRFLAAWRQYAQALRVRNHALRLQDERLVRSSEPVFCELAEQVHRMRREVVDDLTQRLARQIETLGSDLLPAVQVELAPGWNIEKGLKASLAETRAADMDRRHTMYGPHRAELKIQTEGRAAKSLISRGQRKLFMVALALAQAEQIDRLKGNRPVVLIDDFGSEWSLATQARVLAQLTQLSYQFVITMLDPPPQPVECSEMFHVEHGRAQRVI